MKTADDYLIQIALDHGLVRGEQVLEARREMVAPAGGGESPPRLIDALVRKGWIDEGALTAAVADAFGLPYVELENRSISREVTAAVPLSFVQEHGVVPFALDRGTLHVAASASFAMEVIDSLAHVTGMRIVVSLALSEEIKKTIQRCHGPAAHPAPHFSRN